MKKADLMVGFYFGKSVDFCKIMVYAKIIVKQYIRYLMSL